MTGDRRALLAAARAEALAVRGTVMLEAVGDGRRWCAVCASVQGDLELRIAEPRRGWRAGRGSTGERWLADNEFTHGNDAWVRPMRRLISARECAAILDDALSQALRLPGDTPLERSLVVRGVPDAPAGASHEDHLAAGLRSLVAAGDGSVHVDIGSPARPLAWVWLVDGALVVEVEARGTELEIGRFASPATAARELAARLAHDFGCTDADPLFLTLVPDAAR